MQRFDELIRASMIIRDVRNRYPETEIVFRSFGFRASCDDCSIEDVARKHGLASAEVVAELNRMVFGGGAKLPAPEV